jgi:prepilin-type N-terminal cleavage/methylation domain-containing protein
MYKTNKTVAQAGFTLVELSIVIVIIGFLVAGIAAGANLVKQAQIRSVISDFNSFQTGYNGFVGKYNAAPGDLSTASSYWSGANVCSVTVTTVGTGRCNGDGNGTIDATATAATEEVAAAWKHLQLAGFIGAGISPLADAIADLAVGVNAPVSKITGTGYMLAGTASITRTANAFAGIPGISTNNIYLGRLATAAPLTSALTSGALRAEDAFNIDLKLDDGLASNFTGATTGRLRSITGSAAAGVTDCATAATGVYTIANATTACLVGMALD